jgi:hypothetical protein
VDPEPLDQLVLGLVKPQIEGEDDPAGLLFMRDIGWERGHISDRGRGVDPARSEEVAVVAEGHAVDDMGLAA